MKTNNLSIFLISALSFSVLTQACNSNENRETADSTMSVDSVSHPSTLVDTVDTMKDGTADNKFLEQAAIGGLVEIEMGKIGQQMATDPSIKSFAAMIQNDHTAAKSQLDILAVSKGFKLPATLPSLKQEHLKDLKKTSGTVFDQYYINMLVEDHIIDISLYEGATKSADTAISNFAKKILPKLKKHYEEGRVISMKFDQNKNLK